LKPFMNSTRSLTSCSVSFLLVLWEGFGEPAFPMAAFMVAV